MTEQEYLIATTLARVRSATDVLRDINIELVYRDQLECSRQIFRSLSEWTLRLERDLDVLLREN